MKFKKSILLLAAVTVSLAGLHPENWTILNERESGLF